MSVPQVTSPSTSLSGGTPILYAFIDYDDAYVQPLILNALSLCLSESSYAFIHDLGELPNSSLPLLVWTAYESIPFEHVLSKPNTALSNAYVIRKALIRKHYLSETVSTWVTKHPASALKDHVKPTVHFELDYAEFLDEALVEDWDLKEAWERDEGKDKTVREWWILKPGMSDRGQGIRLFSTEGELRGIFEEWEKNLTEDEDEAATVDATHGKEYIMTSHLRHFIAQPYIHPPLLIQPHQTRLPRKFHIRTYVLAAAALRVYVYKEMLALFAADPYAPPWENDDLKRHLTNTCLQDGSREGSVCKFWDLENCNSEGSLQGWKESAWEQICSVTGELFSAAAQGMMVHFQTLPNAFELFGIDFLVDEEGTVWLLEVNAFPDFKQTGDDLQGVIQGLFEEVVRTSVMPFFRIGGSTSISFKGTSRCMSVPHPILHIDVCLSARTRESTITNIPSSKRWMDRGYHTRDSLKDHRTDAGKSIQY